MSDPVYIYFVQCDGGDHRIKIGMAGDVAGRLSALAVGCPYPLRLLGAFSGTPADERTLHRRFRNHRAFGEWFDPVPDILEFVAQSTSRGRLVGKPRRPRPTGATYSLDDMRAAIDAMIFDTVENS